MDIDLGPSKVVSGIASVVRRGRDRSLAEATSGYPWLRVCPGRGRGGSLGSAAQAPDGRLDLFRHLGGVGLRVDVQGGTEDHPGPSDVWPVASVGEDSFGPFDVHGDDGSA